jgi:hypothetical protein
VAGRGGTDVPLPVDPNPPLWPGAKPDELRVAPDGLPAVIQGASPQDFEAWERALGEHAERVAYVRAWLSEHRP